MVVAVPPAVVVEGEYEQVAAIQRLQHGLAITLPGHGIAQRAGEAVQDARTDQELPNVLGLTPRTSSTR